MIQQAMTAEEFSRRRSELPDAGQWAELIRGVPVTLQPPDLDHGTIVLNLSKQFSAYVHREMFGYPCFDLGIHLERSPDTVLFPAVSYFTEGARFSEADNEYTTNAPAVVIELATSNDRRSGINERVSLYHQVGVKSVWVVDPHARTIIVLRNAPSQTIRLSEFETLNGGPELQGFTMSVGDVFKEPEWV